MPNLDREITKKIKPMLTTTEASRMLHVHPNTLRRWSNSGIIRTQRIGPRADRRFRQDDIKQFLSQLKETKGNPQKVNVAGR